MDDNDRRAAIRAYKETARPAGVFRVRHTASGRSFVGASADLPGMLNRQRFQLDHGSHPERELQRDYQTHGPAAFAFEVLDRLETKDESPAELAAELQVLKDLWCDRLRAAGEPLYGPPPAR